MPNIEKRTLGATVLPQRPPRFSYIDTAQFCEVRAGSYGNARTSDLSANGCYLETFNPLSAGTPVRIRFTLDGEVFEAVGRVVHSQPYMGMGIAFTQIEPKHRATLEKWITRLSAEGNQLQ